VKVTAALARTTTHTDALGISALIFSNERTDVLSIAAVGLLWHLQSIFLQVAA
jgi:hypothetical protein